MELLGSYLKQSAIANIKSGFFPNSTSKHISLGFGRVRRRFSINLKLISLIRDRIRTSHSISATLILTPLNLDTAEWSPVSLATWIFLVPGVGLSSFQRTALDYRYGDTVSAWVPRLPKEQISTVKTQFRRDLCLHFQDSRLQLMTGI